MRGVRLAFENAIDRLCWLAGLVAALCVLAIALMLTYEVALRYLFNSPTTWTYSYSIYASAAIGLLGSAWALRADAHVKVDLAVVWMPERMRRALEVVGSLAGLVFCVVLTWKGWEMVARSYTVNRVSSDTLNTPLFIPQLVLPIGGALLCLQLIRIISGNLAWLMGDRSSKIEEHRAWEHMELGGSN